MSYALAMYEIGNMEMDLQKDTQMTDAKIEALKEVQAWVEELFPGAKVLGENTWVSADSRLLTRLHDKLNFLAAEKRRQERAQLKAAKAFVERVL